MDCGNIGLELVCWVLVPLLRVMQPDWQVPKVHSDQLATAVTPKHGKRGIHTNITLGKQDIHNYSAGLVGTKGPL